MKKIVKIIIGIIICLIIIFGMIFGFNKLNNKTLVNEIATTDVSESIEEQEPKEEKQSMVKIIDNKIQNENLIDEFIEETANAKENMTLQIEVDNTDLIEVEFVPGKMLSTEEGQEAVSYNLPSSNEDYENMYGYYLLKRDEKETRFNRLDWTIKRNIMDQNVYVMFSAIVGNNMEDVLPIICSYDLDSSSYKKDFELNFNQRKDMGVNRIVEPTSSVYPYMIYTVGGDVTFTIDGDMVYDFKQALESGVITIDKILEQANMDDKYGICKEEMYQDGGTLEYLYDDYTIIKYSTLDGNEDFVIGPKGDIRNRVDKILYE